MSSTTAAPTAHSQIQGGMMNYVQAAEFLTLSASHLRRMVMERRVPHYKVGGRVVFDPDELRNWLREQYVPVGGRS